MNSMEFVVSFEPVSKSSTVACSFLADNQNSIIGFTSQVIAYCGNPYKNSKVITVEDFLLTIKEKPNISQNCETKQIHACKKLIGTEYTLYKEETKCSTESCVAKKNRVYAFEYLIGLNLYRIKGITDRESSNSSLITSTVNAKITYSEKTPKSPSKGENSTISSNHISKMLIESKLHYFIEIGKRMSTLNNCDNKISPQLEDRIV